MNAFFSKLNELGNRFPISVEYRSSIAAASALLIVVGTLVLGLPAHVAMVERDRDRAAAAEAPDASVDPGAVAPTEAAVTDQPVTGPTRAAASRPGTTEKKGGVSVTTSQDGVPVADLFTPAEDRIGITNSTITLCTHAALSLAAAFDTHPEDLNVYWRNLNDNGGVHGRTVNATYEDDAYSGDAARLAAERCNEKRPFILGGGIGFDQIPLVRAWAETNHVLYLHHIAKKDLSKKYSFSFFPTVDKMGEMFGEWIKLKYPNQRIGVVWRNSENWQPGHEGFKRLVEGSVNLVADLPVRASQAVYSNEISKLEEEGAEVVFFWENALMATDMIEQARKQEYFPKWVIFPFNTTTDAIGAEAGRMNIDGIAAWAPYSAGEYGGPFAVYADELRKFEAAQRKYGNPTSEPNDILFMTWLANKQVHQLLQECGRDCTRNKIAGLMLSGRTQAAPPNCPVDFTRNGRVGGYNINVFETYVKSPQTSGWREVVHCQEHL